MQLNARIANRKDSGAVYIRWAVIYGDIYEALTGVELGRETTGR